MSNVFKGSELKVTTTSQLGKADLKKLRAMLMEEFPALTKKMLDKTLSGKVEINVLNCSNGTKLYVPGDSPATWFDDGFGAIFPTIFTLWKLPTMMPELVTHGPVSKFLLPKERSAGADMMLPGVIVPEGGLGSFSAGQKRCVRVEGNAMPFAVGKMLVSSDEVAKTGMKGRAMAVKHVYRDSLWAYGGRKVPNDGFGADEIVPAAAAAEAELVPAAAAAEAEPGAEEEEDDEEDDAGERNLSERGSRVSGGVEPLEGLELAEMKPDELMEYCFFAALKTTCTDKELPITADKFYTNHMQLAR